MIPPARIARFSPIVLHITGSTIEALVPRRNSNRAGDSSSHRLIRIANELPIGADLASTVLDCLPAHGVRARSVIVALGPDVLESQVVELPMLQGRNLEAVVGRRAAGMCDLLPEQTAYSAIALDVEDEDNRRWLLHATDRRALRAFQHEMRRGGYPVTSILPARTAPFLSSRCRGAAGEENATLVALFEVDSCAIGLLSGGRLVQLSVLPGGVDAYLSDPQTARSFVQEMRGIDAFWRRRSRGERVGAVVIGGVESTIVRDIEIAIQTALGDVEVRSLDIHSSPVASEAEGELGIAVDSDVASLLDEPAERAQLALLSSFLTTRVAALDLAVELPPKPATLAAVATVSLLIWGAIGGGLRAELLAEANVTAVSAKVSETAVADMDELARLEADARTMESQIQATLGDLRRSSEMGLPLSGVLNGIDAAFDGHGVLLSASGVAGTPSQGQAGAVRLRGAVADELDRTSYVLQSLELRLAAIPGVASVSIDMPSLTDRVSGAAGAAGSALGFSAVLNLEAPEVPDTDLDLELAAGGQG